MHADIPDSPDGWLDRTEGLAAVAVTLGAAEQRGSVPPSLRALPASLAALSAPSAAALRLQHCAPMHTLYTAAHAY